jgi:hypothetical protein
MFFFCCVLSGRGLCDELITRPEECYRLWRVVVCDQENLLGEEAIARAGLQSQREKKNSLCYCSSVYCTVSACDVHAASITEIFPCFFLSCKANVRV